MIDKLKEWGNVRLLCPCGGDGQHKYHFELQKQGGEIYYVCMNEKCRSNFSSDIHLKAMTLLDRWYEKNHTYEGFSAYFRVKDESMRLRYVGVEHTTPTHDTILVEVANLTKQHQYRKIK